MPKKKATNKTQAMRFYEQALRLDESNSHLQHRVALLTDQFNTETKRIKNEKIYVFASQLIKVEGDWSDVTAEVNAQRLWKAPQKKIDAQCSATLLTDIISLQSYVWVGQIWCPWLPAVGMVLLILMFCSLSHAMMGIKIAPKSAFVSGGSEWSADETKRTFMLLSLGALLVCTIPQLFWLNQEPTCGPHSAESYEDEDGNVVEGSQQAVFETFSVYLQWLEDRSREDGEAHFFGNEMSVLAGFLFNPPVLIIVICVLWTRFRFYKANYQLLQAELEQEREGAKAEKQSLTGELKMSSKRTADIQCKYGDRVRQYLTERRHERGERRSDEDIAARKAAREAGRCVSMSMSMGAHVNVCLFRPPVHHYMYSHRISS